MRDLVGRGATQLRLAEFAGLEPPVVRRVGTGEKADTSSATRRQTTNDQPKDATVLPFWWSEPHRIENLEELRANVKNQGGSIRQYERLLSAGIIMRRWPQFEWVPPAEHPRSAGLRHALFTAAFGWWSVIGWAITPGVILNNLLGGLDVTAVLMGDRTDETVQARALSDLERAKKRQDIVTVLTLLAVFGVVVLLMVRLMKSEGLM